MLKKISSFTDILFTWIIKYISCKVNEFENWFSIFSSPYTFSYDIIGASAMTSSAFF